MLPRLGICCRRRTDGFWEMGLSQWDTAAGIVLVRDGGFISDLEEVKPIGTRTSAPPTPKPDNQGTQTSHHRTTSSVSGTNKSSFIPNPNNTEAAT